MCVSVSLSVCRYHRKQQREFPEFRSGSIVRVTYQEARSRPSLRRLVGIVISKVHTWKIHCAFVVDTHRGLCGDGGIGGDALRVCCRHILGALSGYCLHGSVHCESVTDTPRTLGMVRQRGMHCASVADTHRGPYGILFTHGSVH